MTDLLEATGVSKSYGSASVLSDVSLSLRAGEIVSIIGENGAGKSTLAKIIAGIVQPDSGTLALHGTPISFAHPGEALNAKIGMVHQELNLAQNLTVTENILLGREPTQRGVLDRQNMNDVARRALARLSVSIDPNRVVSTLSPAQQQMIEIARVLAFDAEIIIFDEPTSSLSEDDSRVLLNLIKRLKSEGVAIIYVSHRLPEVLEISDRIVALRDGRNSGESAAASVTRDDLITMLVGREIKDIYGYTPRVSGESALALKDFRATPWHAPTSLTVRRGEIVGIAGLVGSGRSELLESIFGVTTPESGAVEVNGTPVHITSPRLAWRAGLAYVPESRKEQGLILESSIRENIITSQGARKGLLSLRQKPQEESESDALISQLKIRCSSREQSAGSLSGGNQQKVVLARCLLASPSILLLDEPTRGVDVGARREIYSLLFRLAEEGLAILFVSSELEEVIGIADRVYVMCDGEVRGELTRDALSEHAIVNLASTHSQVAA